MIDFDKIIENFLSRERRPKTIGRYYPSEVGLCLRKVWYTYTQPKETERDLVKIFHAGDMIHEFVADALKSEKNSHIELLDSELPVKFEEREMIISGRIDDLLLVREDGKHLLVEVKSCARLPTDPKPYNVMQLQLYLHLMGVKNGVLLYVEKNSLKSAAFEVLYNEADATEALERFRILHAHLKTGKIPFPEAKKDEKMNWMCKYCEYRVECDEECEND